MSGTGTPCFRVENISKSYRRCRALDGVTIAIPWGVRLAIVGRSGSGKSTLLHLLGLMDAPDSGPRSDVVYFPEPGRQGFSYAGRRGTDRVPLGRRRDRVRGGDFGFVFQRHHLLPFLSSEDNAGLGLTAAGTPPRRRRGLAEHRLNELGVGGKSADRPGHLSGGESQRVAVARALAHEPRVVFADEPTGNLDHENARGVLEALCAWQGDASAQAPRTLVLVTHDFQSAFRYCDHFLVVRDHQLHPGHGHGGLYTRSEVGSAEGLFRLASDEPLAAAAAPAAAAAAPVAPVAPTAAPQSPPRRRVRALDLLRLSWTDLIVSGHRLASFAAFVLLLLATVLTLVAAGFWNGQKAIRARIDVEGAKALIVTGYTDRVPLIDDKTLDEMRDLKLSDGRRLCRDEPRNVFRWGHDEQKFRTKAEGNGPAPEQTAMGRSIAPDDPALARRGWKFDDPHGQEIIVSESFLRDYCRLPLDAEFVWLDYRDYPVKLRVVARAAELPEAPHYILPEPFCQQLKTFHFNPRRSVPFVDLVYPSPPDADAVEAAVREKAGEYALLVERPEDRHRVRLRVPDSKLLTLPVIGGDASKLATTAGRKGRVEPPPPEPERKGVPGSPCATVYLDHVNDRDEAVRLLTDIGLKEAYPAQTQLIRTYERSVRQLANLIFALAATAVLCAVLNLVITTDQRVRARLSEIGILRACGFRGADVRRIFAIEGVVLGVLAAAGGWVLTAFLLGPWIEGIVKSAAEGGTGPDVAGLFRFDPAHVAIVAAGVVAVATVSCGSACRRAVSTPPAEAVR